MDHKTAGQLARIACRSVSAFWVSVARRAPRRTFPKLGTDAAALSRTSWSKKASSDMLQDGF